MTLNMSDDFQPYVGPRPFERADAERFFGRNREARNLLSRVIAHAVVLFYSQSGAGKTSLINAKLIPMLETKGFDILGPARVRESRAKDIEREEIQNLYVFNVLRNWDDNKANQRELVKTSISDFLRKRERSGQSRNGSPYIAIFDQFEELFTSYPERWKDRETFFEQVGKALHEDRLMRVVFVMREDYIAELDPYVSLLPEKLRTRYRLEHLREPEALRAVTKPLEGTRYRFADGVAESLIDNLLMVSVETPSGAAKIKGEFAEPVQLQVVCQSLWDNCQSSWRNLKPDQPRIITAEDLETFGDVDVALSTFYENAIRKVVHSTGLKEGKLRAWFEDTLITPAGTRGTIFRGKKETGDIPANVIDELVNHHLLTSEIRGGSKWLELTHDRLIEPIKTSNERWRLRHSEGEKTRKLLEARAAHWVRNGRNNSELLDEGELLEARRWLESPSAADLGFSNALLALVQASRAAVDEVARAQEHALAAEQRRRAEAERERAEEQQRRAEAERERAEEQQRRAEAERERAEEQQRRAEAERERAEEQQRRAEAERERAEEQQRRNYDQARATRRLVSLVAALVAIFLVATVAALVANHQRMVANYQRNQATTAQGKAEKAQQNAENNLKDSNRNEYLVLLRFREAAAAFYMAQREYKEALPIYKNLLDAYPVERLADQKRVLEAMALLYEKEKKPKEEKEITKQIERLPRSIEDVITEIIQHHGVESAISQYRELKINHPNDYIFDENYLNAVGYDLLRVKRTTEAIEIFKLNVEAYPEGWNVYDSLGEAYMIAGDKELAISNYEESLRLNPFNANAEAKLKKLKAEQ
jgi:tetratricopeptide (TPR) repeat protein